MYNIFVRHEDKIINNFEVFSTWHVALVQNPGASVAQHTVESINKKISSSRNTSGRACSNNIRRFLLGFLGMSKAVLHGFAIRAIFITTCGVSSTDRCVCPAKHQRYSNDFLCERALLIEQAHQQENSTSRQLTVAKCLCIQYIVNFHAQETEGKRCANESSTVSNLEFLGSLWFRLMFGFRLCCCRRK